MLVSNRCGFLKSELSSGNQYTIPINLGSKRTFAQSYERVCQMTPDDCLEPNLTNATPSATCVSGRSDYTRASKISLNCGSISRKLGHTSTISAMAWGVVMGTVTRGIPS